MNRRHFHLTVAALLLVAMSSALHAAKLSEVAAALDMNTSFFVKQQYLKYKYDEIGFTVEDEDGNPVIVKSSSDSYWSVQSKEADGTAPYSGKSCLRSNLGSATPSVKTDNTCARIYLTFTGPGTFSFAYKTQTDSDVLNVYVDGQLSEVSDICGYGLDQEWETAELELPGGLTPNGTYAHEVIIEFRKSEPSFDGDGKYDKEDGPEKPDKDDYDLTDPDDLEYYNEAMAEYNAFVNCVWLDAFQWTPEPVRLVFAQDKDYSDLHVQDYLKLSLISNAPDFGYRVTYTLNGQEPTGTSPSYFTIADNGEAVENPIMVSQTSVVKAMVFIDDKTPLSPVTSLTANITVKASNPEFSVVSQPDGSLKVTMQTQYLFPADDAEGTGSPCEGAIPTDVVDRNPIHYTVDGTSPVGSPLVYDADTGLIIKSPCRIQAVAQRDCVLDSDIVSLAIVKTAAPAVTVLNPQGKIEPYNVYSTPKGLTVKAEAASNATLQVSFDNGSTYADFNGTFYLKAENGESTATALIRAIAEGQLPSDPVSVSAMAATDQWTVSTPDSTATGKSFAIRPGWNLLSFPCYLTQAGIDAILNCGTLLTYDNQAKAFVKATTIKPGDICWLFATSPAPAATFGATAVAIELPPCSNWTFYGPSSAQPVPEGIVAWEYADGKYQPSTTFVPGKGYLIRNR